VVSERVKEDYQGYLVVGENNRPKFRLFKSHQSLIESAIETLPRGLHWTGRSIISGLLIRSESGYNGTIARHRWRHW
jgi:hypothetical protein